MAELSGEGWSPPASVRDVVEFHWFHVGVNQSLMLAVLSEGPIWYVGHFEGGRMRRCRGELCRLCVSGVGRQLRYVICAVEMTTRQVGVLELGKAPMLLIRDRALSRGGLRGLIIELSRAGRAKHARLDVSILEERCPLWVLETPALDVRSVLERTWEREVGSGVVSSRAERVV